MRFLIAQAVLDVPPPLVEALQRMLVEGGVVGGRAAVAPGLLEQLQLQPHVGELGGIDDARLLDPEDRDLVEELPRRERNEDVLHERDPSNSSSLAVTCSTRMRSMTPGTSILWFHGSRAGSQPRKVRAASA